MGSTSIAVGAPDSRAGIMDGLVIGTHSIEEESRRSPSADADRIGKILSQSDSATVELNERQEAKEEVIRSQLWFALPLDERTQFGTCFSRMLLKCLRGMEQEEQEVHS